LLSGSAVGAYINCHIGADFILANLLFSSHYIFFSLFSHHALYIICVATQIFHVQQGKWDGRAPGIASGFAGGSVWRLGQLS